jgi:cytochrome c biogenesis protein CcmG, thiol:disulfide interchange protein DsbE
MSKDSAHVCIRVRGAGPIPEPRDTARSWRSTLIAVLSVVAVLILATWFGVDRQGLGEIGRGGQNLKLLPRAGQPAPDFIVPLTDGRIVRLSDFRGQPVWLNFWGSWCPPCRAEMPDMVAAYTALRPRGLVVLAVSLDESMADAASYASRAGATYLIASDPYRVATGDGYRIANFPTHILIDRDGIIQKVLMEPLTEASMIAYAETILAGSRAE